MLREEPGFPLVTVVCAHLRRPGEGADGEDVTDAVVSVASGGHPLPLRIDTLGDVQEVGRAGVVLGAAEAASWPEEQFRLGPGETLLFYTDGATEAPGVDDRFGEARLTRAATGTADPAAVIDRIEHALEDFQHGPLRDDRALLAIQYAEADVPALRRG